MSLLDLVPGRRLMPSMLVQCLAVSGFLVASYISPPSQARNTPVVTAIERAKPAVVNIQGNKSIPPQEAVRRSGSEPQKVNGMGTGVVIDPRGYILTNYHVVEGVSRIEVQLADGRKAIARLVAHDRTTDLAVIKIHVSEPLPVIPIGTSSDLMHGEDVIAIGNAYGYGHTVTRGIISGLHRPVGVSEVQQYDDLIQTDAGINPGNSGGPLLNIDGEMIGINSAVRMEAQNIGFAIPVDQVMEVAARLMDPQRLHGIDHGLVLEDQTGGGGVRARTVRPASPAALAGVQPGDRIQLVDGHGVSRGLDVQRALLDKKPGDAVAIQLQRGGMNTEVLLQLSSTTPATTHPTAQRIWQVLGLQLEPISPTQFAHYRPQDRDGEFRPQGGLRVVAVRPGSPAYQQIREGEILVGLYHHETLSLDHVEYLLNMMQQSRADQFPFHLIRNGRYYVGNMQIAWGATNRGLQP